MFEGLPNLSLTFGYTNASWTLRADLVAAYVCRLLNHMRRVGADVVVPVNDDPAMPRRPLIEMRSGYIQRAVGAMPRQGDRDPWILPQSYRKDLASLGRAEIADGVLRFSPRPPTSRQAPTGEPPSRAAPAE